MSTIGKIVLDLAPGENNPRNSEGAFIELNDGRLMFAYKRFVGTGSSDDCPCEIAARYSSDGGNTWTGEDRILFTREPFNAKNLMCVSLLRMANDDVGLFFGLRMGFHDARMRLFRSADEGGTFGEGTLCIPALGYFVVNNDRVIRTRTGRLIAPSSLHRNKDGVDWDAMVSSNLTRTGHDQAKFDNRAIGIFFYSDDDGKTWQEAADCVYPPSNKISSGLQEAGVTELKDGTLWAYFRTTEGRQYQSFSYDDGEHWTDAAPSRFTSPCSPLSVKRLKDGRLLAIWNPAPNYPTRDLSNDGGWGGRTPYVAALSSDEGATWSKELFVEDGSEDAGYCYCAIHPMEDCVLLAYCAGNREDGGTLNRLRIRKILLSELEQP